MFRAKKNDCTMRRLAITGLGSLLLPGVAAAHPGHNTEFGLLHYLTGPFHLAVGILALAIGIFLVVLSRRIARRVHLSRTTLRDTASSPATIRTR